MKLETIAAETLSMRQLFARLAEALGELESIAEDIDAAIAGIVISADEKRMLDRSALQKVDLLVQSLAALKRVSSNAEEFSDEASVFDQSRLVNGVLIESIRVKFRDLEEATDSQNEMGDPFF